MTIKQGLNPDGSCGLGGASCPLTTFTYTSLAGYDPLQDTADGTLALPATKQALIATGNSTTTSYSWQLKDFSPAQYADMTVNPVKKIQVIGSVMDSGGLNLRTCFLSDMNGNVISTTQPRALATCP